MKSTDNLIIQTLFDLSKNSKYHFYSKNGEEPNEPIHLTSTLYYKLKTKNSEFRVGYEYTKAEKILSLVISTNKQAYSAVIDDFIRNLGVIATLKLKHVNDMHNHKMALSRGIIVDSRNFEKLINLQEFVLNYFQNKT